MQENRTQQISEVACADLFFPERYVAVLLLEEGSQVGVVGSDYKLEGLSP